MKLLFSMITLFFALSAFAQTAAVKDIPAGEDTNIAITKGKNNTQKNYEITQGEEEIGGDPAILSADARTSWKQACADWKKEIKDNNKDNQVIAISCGTPHCDKKDVTEITCMSNGTYKIKTRIKD